VEGGKVGSDRISCGADPCKPVETVGGTGGCLDTSPVPPKIPPTTTAPGHLPEESTIDSLARTIAEQGLRIGAIKLNAEAPFQWASGYRMPVYNDNRMFLFHPETRRAIARGLGEIVADRGIAPEVVAGTATAGIPHGALLADLLSLPFIYIRDKPKGHGLRNRIEGLDADSDLEGRRVVVIEDLISTGGSSARAVEAVREANGLCSWCLSIFSYGLEKAAEEFAALAPPCAFESLLTFPVLLDVARDGGFLSSEHIALLEGWRKDPFGWGEKHGFPRVERPDPPGA
jgi:orotate phosphoribosyltransferase